MMKRSVFATAALLAAISLAPSHAMAEQKYVRPEVLNAIYQGNSAPVMPRNDAEEKAMTGYIMGLMTILGKSCSSHNTDQAAMMGMMNVLGMIGGGLGFLSSSSDGENDAKSLIKDYGCESPTTRTIIKNFNSFSWIR